MARYKEYKNCCIEWIGEIPSHWDTAPLWSLSSCNDDVLGDDTRDDYAFEYYDVSSVEEGVIGKGQHYTFLDAPSRARRLVRPSDVVISTVRTYLRAIARIDMEQAGSVFSTGFAVLRPTAIDPAYFFYCLSSEGFIEEVVKHSDGVSYPAISPNLLLKIRLPKPPLDEQKAIANYLKSRTAEINRLINETEKTIELLEEYRKSVISETVTKGLNPDAPTKNSGIEWIGEVPKHWKETKLYYIMSAVSGATPSKDITEYWDGEIPWASSMEIREKYIFDTTHYITQEAVESCSTQISPKNTIVIVVRSGILKHTIPVSILGKPMAVNQDIKALAISEDNYPEYIQYLIQGNNDAFLALYSKLGTTVDSLDFDRFCKAHIFIPNKQEQLEICHYLDARIAQINSNKLTLESLINRLIDYRKSLIYEAVTGKFKVPGVE